MGWIVVVVLGSWRLPHRKTLKSYRPKTSTNHFTASSHNMHLSVEDNFLGASEIPLTLIRDEVQGSREFMSALIIVSLLKTLSSRVYSITPARRSLRM